MWGAYFCMGAYKWQCGCYDQNGFLYSWVLILCGAYYPDFTVLLDVTFTEFKMKSSIVTNNFLSNTCEKRKKKKRLVLQCHHCLNYIILSHFNTKGKNPIPWS